MKVVQYGTRIISLQFEAKWIRINGEGALPRPQAINPPDRKRAPGHFQLCAITKSVQFSVMKKSLFTSRNQQTWR